MEAVDAPVAAWEGFAREVAGLMRDLESELAVANSGVRADQLRLAEADLRAVLAVITDRIAS